MEWEEQWPRSHLYSSGSRNLAVLVQALPRTLIPPEVCSALQWGTLQSMGSLRVGHD